MKFKINACIIMFVFAMVAMPAFGGQPSDFDAAVSSHFKVDQELIDEVRWAGVSDDDVPVVFLIAKESKLDPVIVAEMRARGDRWSLLASTRNLDPGIFLPKVSGYVHSDTYGPIIHKYQSLPKSRWNEIRLSDKEIVDLVNLQFVSKQYDYSLNEVMAMVDSGQSFADIQTGPVGETPAVAESETKKRKVSTAGM